MGASVNHLWQDPGPASWKGCLEQGSRDWSQHLLRYWETYRTKKIKSTRGGSDLQEGAMAKGRTFLGNAWSPKKVLLAAEEGL